MTRVIAIQETQLQTLKENYDKSKPLNNAAIINETLAVPSIDSSVQASQNPTPASIDMEEQVVNLNTNNNDNSMINESATMDVFGQAPSATIPENNSTPTENPIINNNESFATPFIDPTMPEQPQSNPQNNFNYIELLNSLRNMITEFANSAYSAIDEIQEKHLQKKEETAENQIPSTGADLVTNNPSNATEIPGIPTLNSGTTANMPYQDLDNTIVIPGSAISDAINQGNSLTM